MILVPSATGRRRQSCRVRRPSQALLSGFAADLFYANINRFVDEVLALVKGAPTPVRYAIAATRSRTQAGVRSDD